MKTSLLDISLSELRDFISFCDKNYQISLSNMSLVSLKIRLQFIIQENQFNNFESFRKYLENTKRFRDTFFDNIISKPNELFRDAEQWEVLCDIIASIKGKEIIEICLFEFGNNYDTATLLIALSRYHLLSKCSITIIKNKIESNTVFSFNKKDLEIGELNFNSIKKNDSLIDYFLRFKEYYQYYPFDHSNLVYTNLNDINKSNHQYDILIARNYTLNFNFTEHEAIFNNYLKLLISGGYLFTGSKENFKWCINYTTLTHIDKHTPIYLKKT